MRVIVERPFSRYAKGEVIPEMPANQARGLIARGMVREMVEDRAVDASPVNRIMRRATVRKAG